MQENTKTSFFFEWDQYLQKSMEDEFDVLPADKHKCFLLIDSITLGVCSQACPKYLEQKVYNIFAYS